MLGQLFWQALEYVATAYLMLIKLPVLKVFTNISNMQNYCIHFLFIILIYPLITI